MIYSMSELTLDDERREQLQGYDADFPYTAIDCALDRYAGRCVPWHWHATLEINIVQSGVLETSTPNGARLLQPGDGILVNANTLHRNRAAEGMRGVRVHTHMFSRDMVGVTQQAMRRYVRPLTGCAGLETLALSREDAAHRAVLDLFGRAFRAAGEEAPGFELEIGGLLLQAWRGIYALARPRIDVLDARGRPESARIKQMLTCIRDRYHEDLTPAEIAAAAGVCERECFRCFRQELGTTPLAALTEVRVRRAAELLREGRQSVTRIALACGFSSASYFGKVFRRHMHASPREYRRSQRAFPDERIAVSRGEHAAGNSPAYGR